MEELFKIIGNLNRLIKSLKEASKIPTIPAIPTVKGIAAPSMTPKATNTKIPGANTDSKKDPRKIAQQIKDGSMSTKTQKIMFKTSTQWDDKDVEKADNAIQSDSVVFHIHKDGFRITDKPLSIKEINDNHGGVKKLENSGFSLIRHNSKSN